MVHFIVGGAVLFGAYALFGTRETRNDDDTTIVVDRRGLLTFLQYRANAFESETFGAALDAMSDAELQRLIDAYIQEEVLYREAKSLGLDANDNIIRQRMVQAASFLLSDLSTADDAVDEDALTEYFEKNIDAYAIEPWVTFTHVFFDAGRRGDDGARAAAQEALGELNAAGASFNDAPGFGDGFPFLRNYVERTLEYVAGHFGYEFASRIAEVEPSAEAWRGPFRSAYGEHLVMLTGRAERRYPSLDEVRSDVERDYSAERADEALADMTNAIRDRYRIELREIRSGAR